MKLLCKPTTSSRNEPDQGKAESEVSKMLGGVFLSLFKTVDLCLSLSSPSKKTTSSARSIQIRSDVWYSSRTKFSPKLIGPAETTEVWRSRRRSRQSSTKPLSSCIRRATSSQSRFLWRWGSRFVKRRARSISAPTFSTTAPRGFLLLMEVRRRGPHSQWAVCPSIVAPRISRKLATKSCGSRLGGKHGH